MKTRYKALLLTLCVVTLVAASVFGTLAYLTDNESDTNTFQVGSVRLKLDEAPVGDDGIKDAGDRVKANSYHLLPGHTYDKDPMVTMGSGSEAAYVRMMVKVNTMDQMKAAFPKANFPEFYATDKDNSEIFLLQNLCVDKDGKNTWNNDTWHFYKYHEGTQTYEFRYNGIVAKGTTELAPLFTQITVPGSIDKTQLQNLNEVTIEITAHAIQAAGFDTADAAWAAFEAQTAANS